MQVPTHLSVLNVHSFHGNTNKSKRCGYCKNSKPDPGDCKWGFESNKTRVDDYEKMMRFGWRRCGTYYYKYDFEKSCCQPYTIRLDVTEFNIGKS